MVAKSGKSLVKSIKILAGSSELQKPGYKLTKSCKKLIKHKVSKC